MLFMAPHPPVWVPRSRSLVIGRDEECDITVPSRLASRRHAEVRFDDDRVVIEDLGSKNGTFVNGAPIQSPTAIKAGDVIALGGAQLTCCSVDPTRAGGPGSHPDETTICRDVSDVIGASAPDSFRGDVSQVPPDQILQLIATGRHTGVLGIVGEDGPAHMWFEQGRPIHAETGELDGDEAALAICRRYRGRFLFEAGHTPRSRTVKRTVEELLLEVSRIEDEMARTGAYL